MDILDEHKKFIFRALYTSRAPTQGFANRCVIISHRCYIFGEHQGTVISAHIWFKYKTMSAHARYILSLIHIYLLKS